jgi:hypothetical protein
MAYAIGGRKRLVVSSLNLQSFDQNSRVMDHNPLPTDYRHGGRHISSISLSIN